MKQIEGSLLPQDSPGEAKTSDSVYWGVGVVNSVGVEPGLYWGGSWGILGWIILVISEKLDFRAV